MERVTLRIPEAQAEKIEALVEEGEFPSKSEVLRSGLRTELSKYEFDEPFTRREERGKRLRSSSD